VGNWIREGIITPLADGGLGVIKPLGINNSAEESLNMSFT
jgi:hypothetical protein